MSIEDTLDRIERILNKEKEEPTIPEICVVDTEFQDLFTFNSYFLPSVGTTIQYEYTGGNWDFEGATKNYEVVSHRIVHRSKWSDKTTEVQVVVKEI